MPVALWLLMAAAFLPCSAKPWQTSGCEGELGIALESLQGKRDLI